MKKLLLFILVLINVSIFAQTDVKITSKSCIPKKGFHLKLVKIIEDSRCPEGVTCVWAGEVSANIAVYKDKKLVVEKTIVFNSKNTLENKNWFQNYYSKKIKSIAVLPYPKQGKTVKFKNQYIYLVFD